MDRFTVQKLFKGHYQVLDDRGESLFEGNISECYAWIRLFLINIIEEGTILAIVVAQDHYMKPTSARIVKNTQILKTKIKVSLINNK